MTGPAGEQETLATPDLLCLKVEPHGDCVVIRVAGELDFTTVGRLCGAAAAAAAAMEQPRLVLDLADLSFCDSSGLMTLASIWKAAHAQGGKVVVARVPPRSRVLFRRTGVDHYLEMADSVADAVAALSAPPQH